MPYKNFRMKHANARLFNSIVAAAVIGAAIVAGIPGGARAATGNAALSLSPVNGTDAVGQTFTVSVMLDSGGGLGVNAADGKIAFDPTLLSVVSVSKGNSVFNLWVNDPAFSNTAGTISFSGGSNNAYTGSAGDVFDITFTALKAGTATLTFSSADALAADGQGTDILGGTSGATFTIGGSAPPASQQNSSGSGAGGGGSSSAAPAAPPPASFTPSVTITSATHPDPTKWYNDPNPSFSWQLTPDIAGVSTAFDRNPNTYPRRSSEGLISTKQYTGVGQGTWYFHIRFEDALGDWSDPVTMAVNIDTTPPLPFTLSIQPGAGIDGRTTIAFNATDTVSGVDHYLAVFDGGASTTIALADIQNGVYTAPPLLPGKHTVAIFAVDQAGNSTEADGQFQIPGIGSPEITNFPATVVEQSPIVIEGVADSGANVTLDIDNASGKSVSEGKMVADATGHWLYAVESGLPSGKYTLVVSMVTTQGATASTTADAAMNVLPAPFLDRFGWIIIVILLACIGGLIVFGIYKKKITEIRVSLAQRENEDVRQKTKAVFEALREEVDDQVSHLAGGAAQAQGEAKLEPENVLDAMRTALAISESTIAKEIDDVDRALAEGELDGEKKAKPQ